MKIPKALAKELELPVTCTHKGELVTLREFISKKDKKSYLSLSSLNPTQQAKITVERLKSKSEVKVGMIGGGMIDKERAIAEVKALSPLGQVFINSQQHIIDILIEEVESGRFKEFVQNYDD